jgi:signal transduction histidine kinase
MTPRSLQALGQQSSTPAVPVDSQHADAGIGPPPMRARLISLLLRPKTPPVWLGLMVAASFIVAETGAVLMGVQVAPGDAFGVVYLLGVLVVSTVWGFGLATATSVASALAFDYFRGWPGPFEFGADDWTVVGVFVMVALVANTLASLVRTRAVEADHRRGEAERSRDQLRTLAELQSSLRRVATLVARAAPPFEVFATVAGELARCLGVHHSALVRFEVDGGSVLLATHDDRGPQMPLGTRFAPEGEHIAAMVFRTGRPARMDSHDNAAGATAAMVRAAGLGAGVGAPIMVDGRVWGAAIVGSFQCDPLSDDTESRLGDFADLVATAIANAETRAQLTASRARIVSAGDEARRRFERDLHDGAQQRLVSLGLKLRDAEAAVPADLESVRRQMSEVVDGLVDASKDLQDLSRGIHPAVLSRGGLAPALKTLVRRSTVPVELDLGVEGRLPDCVEVAAYYVVAESLTNAAKHARASEVTVKVDTDGDDLRLSVRDDGAGGADSGRGSGLIGLRDRVEALGGRLLVSSPVGSGTSLVATIPIPLPVP